MKPKLYLESTIRVISWRGRVGTSSWPDNKNARTMVGEAGGDFEIFVSEIVFDEISTGEAVMAKRRIELIKPFALLGVNDQVIKLASAMIQGGPLPKKAARDAAHIALSAVHGMHFLLTWTARTLPTRNVWEDAEICEAHG